MEPLLKPDLISKQLKTIMEIVGSPRKLLPNPETSRPTKIARILPPGFKNSNQQQQQQISQDQAQQLSTNFEIKSEYVITGDDLDLTKKGTLMESTYKLSCCVQFLAGKLKFLDEQQLAVSERIG